MSLVVWCVRCEPLSVLNLFIKQLDAIRPSQVKSQVSVTTLMDMLTVLRKRIPAKYLPLLV